MSTFAFVSDGNEGTQMVKGWLPVKNGFFRALPKWEGGPAQIFAYLQDLHFWSMKGASIFQNANNLNFKLFLGCI